VAPVVAPAPLHDRDFGWFMGDDDTTITLPGVSFEPDRLSGELSTEITLVSNAIARVAVLPQPFPVAPESEGRAGLTRRVPGASLSPGLRADTILAPAPPASENAAASWQQRDPAAERASLDAFANGLAMGAAAGAGTHHTKEDTE
jgi:hypothetical protein